MKNYCPGCGDEIRGGLPEVGRVLIKGQFWLNCGNYPDGEQCVIKVSDVEFCNFECFVRSVLERFESGKQLLKDSNSVSGEQQC